MQLLQYTRYFIEIVSIFMVYSSCFIFYFGCMCWMVDGMSYQLVRRARISPRTAGPARVLNAVYCEINIFKIFDAVTPLLFRTRTISFFYYTTVSFIAIIDHQL